jgi:thiazole synthase
MTYTASDPLVVGTRTYLSRLLLGTGGFTRMETLEEAVRASGT